MFDLDKKLNLFKNDNTTWGDVLPLLTVMSFMATCAIIGLLS